jgi:hypothetical protein
MRMLLKAVYDTDAANEIIGSSKAQEALRRVKERLKPEAFYAVGEDGHRAILVVFDLADPSQIPMITEPFYQQGKAKVTLTPCLNFEELSKGFEEFAAREEG